jgi:hypothetical protein
VEMSVVRVRREANYTVIPNEIINDKRLHWQELGLLVYLLSKPTDWDIRIPALAKDRDLKERTIYGIFRRYREFGYASMAKHRDGTAEWTVTDSPATPPPKGEGEKNATDRVNTPDGKNCKQQKPQVADFASSKKPHGKNCHVLQSTEYLQSTDGEEDKGLSSLAREDVETKADAEPGQADPEDLAQAEARKRGLLSRLLQDMGVAITPMHPELIRMLGDGITNEEAQEAVARTRLNSKFSSGQQIPAGWLVKVAGDVIAERASRNAKTPTTGQGASGSFNQQRRGSNYEQRAEKQQRRESNVSAFANLAISGAAGGGAVPSHGNQLSGQMDAIDAPAWTRVVGDPCGVG